MNLSKKHYSPRDRTLADFPDEIICRRSGDNGAVLDTGFNDSVSDPDFSPSGHGKNYTESSKNCGRRIREAALDPDRYGCLKGYDLNYRLMRHWDRKEKFALIGIDPNDVIRKCHDSFGDWPLGGSWLERVKGARQAEFFFQLLVATGQKGIEDGIYDAESVKPVIMAELVDEFPQIAQSVQHPGIPRPRDEETLRDILNARLIMAFDFPDTSNDADDGPGM
jgi:hypothetical protein